MNSDLVRVLVVDDDARVRAALTGLLDQVTGLAVLALDAGQTARFAALSGRRLADVAVVDVPRDDPAHLVRQLSPLVPVVAVGLSGASRRAALDAGARAFLEKDGAVGPLVAAIRAAAGPRHGDNGPVASSAEGT